MDPQGRSAQQLAEVVATLASCSTAAVAAQAGVEQIAECFDAEVGALLEGPVAVASVGFRHDRLPPARLMEVVSGAAREVDVPGAGSCPAIVARVPSDAPRHLILARSGDDGFSREEVSLLQSMGRIMATTLDILALRDRVAATEARFKRIVETANEAIWLFDAAGRTTFANDKTAEILGYAPEDMPRLGLYDVLDEAGRAQAAKNLERRRQGLSDQLECAFLRKDGSYVWVLLNASPLSDRDGVVVGSVCMMSDITPRKQIETMLQKREQQLAEAQRVAHLGSFEWDATEDVLHCSDGLYRVLGVAPDELIRTYAGYTACVYAEDRAIIERSIATRADSAEYRIVRPTGEVVWVQARLEREIDDDGTMRWVRGTVQDISVSKRVEDALRQATARYRLLQAMASAANEASNLDEVLQVAVAQLCAHTGWRVVANRAPTEDGDRGGFAFPVLLGDEVICVLEFFPEDAVGPDDALLETIGQVATQLSRVAERERASRELAMARDAAMTSSRLKSEFLATMSHEIRTPMNGVIGLTGLLLSTELDERQRQYAKGVQSAGEALLAIINDILDFSKIEAGKLELEVTGFDLVQVVEEAAGLVADAAQRKGLELIAYPHPDLPAAVRGDPGRLRQVLLNLASNAVKFTEAGEVVIRAAPVERPGWLRFEISDTGIGIADRDRERLFEPFSQADASTTRRFGGTGLGLAITRRLVAAMGGELGVESEVGRGSTFWFELPLEAETQSVAAPTPGDERALAGLRVLVVDDNETNRAILGDQLAAWRVRADMAVSGEEALDRLGHAAGRGSPYDVALLDALMPGMDGFALARRVSANPALSSPRLVMLTSAADLTAAASKEAGIAAWLTKPVRLSQLRDCLLRGVASPVAAGTARSSPTEAPAPGSRGQVLVVEDNANNQLVAVGILRLLGYRADVAGNGIEALDALARTDYDAVLMDCQMPEMDGFTATREIRRRETRVRHTPVIAMTAGASEADRNLCMEAGMDDYLAKPVKPDDIDAVLDRWIDGGNGAAAPTPAGPGAAVGGVLDETVIEELRGLSPDGALLAEVVQTFADAGPENLAALNLAMVSADAPSVRQVAHRIKGEASTLGAVALARSCAELEELGRSGQLDRARELFARVEAEYARAAAALQGVV
ncbi:MAG: response regulator [Acidimicrobiales bacterium]